MTRHLPAPALVAVLQARAFNSGGASEEPSRGAARLFNRGLPGERRQPPAVGRGGAVGRPRGGRLPQRVRAAARRRRGRRSIGAAGWANVKNLGMQAYLLSHRKGKIPGCWKQCAPGSPGSCRRDRANPGRKHGYGLPLGNHLLLGLQRRRGAAGLTWPIGTSACASSGVWEGTALDALGYLFGRNVYGRSFVTGLGYDPPLHPTTGALGRRCGRLSMARLSGWRWLAEGDRLAGPARRAIRPTRSLS